MKKFMMAIVFSLLTLTVGTGAVLFSGCGDSAGGVLRSKFLSTIQMTKAI